MESPVLFPVLYRLGGLSVDKAPAGKQRLFLIL
jgi:hypothetical protein